MQFLVIAFDVDDSGVADRRREARPAHLALCNEAAEKGHQLVGVDILGADGNARGTAFIAEFPSLDEVDAWMAREPYMNGKVWSKVEVYPCRVKSSFAHLFRLVLM